MQLSGSLTRVLISSLRCKDTNKYSSHKIYRGFFTGIFKYRIINNGNN